MAKQLAEQGELLQKRKKAKRGKRVRLEGVVVYLTTEMLRIAREEEEKVAIKKRKTQLKRIILVSSELDDEGDEIYILLDSDEEVPGSRMGSAVLSHVEV